MKMLFAKRQTLWNERLQSTGYYTVVNIWNHVDLDHLRLTIQGEQIDATHNHPFYVQERNWVQAQDLRQQK